MKYSKEFKVGLFALISIVNLYIGFFYLKGEDFFSSTNKYYVTYRNVGELKVSSPVNINGVTVGKVSNKQLIQGDVNQVVVELDMYHDIILGKGAIAILEGDFLGSISISIDNGNLENPIEPKDTISGEVYKGIQDLFKESALPVANNLEATIKKINLILDNLTNNEEKVNYMIENLHIASIQTRHLMVESNASIKELFDNYNKLALTLNETVNASQPVLKKYGELADSLKSMDIKSTLITLNAVVDSIGVMVNHINNGSGTISKLLKSDALYNNLNKSLEDLDRVLVLMKEEPKHFFSPLGRSRKEVEKKNSK